MILFVFKRTDRHGTLHINRPHAQAVALRILDEHGRRVKTHRLIVEQRASEGCQIMHLQIGRGIGDQRKAGRVRLRESIHGERRDALHDVVLRLGTDAVAGHASTQAAFQVLHAFHGTAHAHGAAQLIGFGSTEVGDGHRHAQNCS